MASDKGWIKLDRAITEHWIFSDAEKFRAWVDLLLMANHEENKFLTKDGLVTIKRGQLLTSIGKLAIRWNWSKDRVYRFLDLLETEHMLQRKSNRFSTLLTIENYGKFQDVPNANKSPNESPNKTPNKSPNESRTRMKKNEKEIKNNSAPLYSDDPERNAEIIDALNRGAVLNEDGSLDYSNVKSSWE